MATSTAAKSNQYRQYVSVYDAKFQAETLKRIRDFFNPEVERKTEKLTDILTDIEGRHSWRQSVMSGLHKRSLGQPASQFEWSDPLEADGVPIKARTAIGATKVNHRLHTPFDRTIVTNKSSYMLGSVPTIETEDETAKEQIEAVWHRNNFDSLILENGQSAAKSGDGYTIFSSPEGVDELVLTKLPDWQAVVIYDQVAGEPEYGLLWYPVDDGNFKGTEHKFYDMTTVWTFRGSGDSMMLVKSEPHGVGNMPIIEWSNNTERLGDVELTITLQDAYDILDSDLSSEVTQLRLAYLLVTGVTAIDEEWVQKLQETGVLAVDENGDAKFLTKDMQSDKVMAIMADMESRIYRYSNSYNPDELGRDKSLTAFQIRQKLFKLEQSSKETELSFKRSLARMTKIIAEFNGALNRPTFDASEIAYTFQRNVPENMIENLKGAREAGFMLSQRQMAALMPFEVDQDLNEQELSTEGVMDMGGEIIGGDDGENTGTE
jgi:SPP1 family phage portal protein